MTTWIDASGGRHRGVTGILSAWIRVVVAPRQFFSSAISTGDQAPGLSFAIAVAVIAATPPVLAGLSGTVTTMLLDGLLMLLAVAVFATPVGLHLLAALETICLMACVPERAGVSQTVQVIAYAIAPCVLTGVCAVVGATTTTIPGTIAAIIWLAATLYGTGLLVYGIAIVHGTSIARAAIGSLLPAIFLFGYAFEGITALTAIL